MPRILVTIFMVLAFAVTANKFYSAVGVDREVVASIEDADVAKFIVPMNDEDSAALAKRREECGNLQSLVAVLNERIGNNDDEGATISYSELVIEVIDSMLSDNVIPTGCVVIVYNSETFKMFGLIESGGPVMLSTAGDVAIGYQDRATTSWVQVVQDNSWRPDTLIVEKDVTLPIQLGDVGSANNNKRG